MRKGQVARGGFSRLVVASAGIFGGPSEAARSAEDPTKTGGVKMAEDVKECTFAERWSRQQKNNNKPFQKKLVKPLNN